MQRSAPHRLGVILVAGVMLAGCGGAAPSSAPPAGPPSAAQSAGSASSIPPASPASTAPSTGSTSPGSFGAFVACPPPPAGASASPAEPGKWPGLNVPAGLSPAVEAEAAELVAAIGNPDTGSHSPAWDAFEAALAAGDAASIRTSAETVMGHLRAACEAVAGYFDRPAADAWAADVRGLLDGLGLAVEALRDAGIGHDQLALEAARGQMQTVLLDHFYQSLKMSNPDAWRVQLASRGWSATASRVRWLTGEVQAAFDGKAETTWLAGDMPAPQWIEVDFGAELAVSGIRLLTYQEGAGATDHRVTVRTGAGKETELARFSGDTRDRQWLELTAPKPVERIRYVRVTTLASPSMIGWREIEVTLAAGAAAAPCPASTTVVTDVAKTAANPATQASDPTMAVDGNEATGWDPGPLRGLNGARGWIRVWYASQVRITEIRVLLGPGSAAATYEVVLFPPGELGTGLGLLKPVPAEGGWVTLAGPNPCLPYESVYFFVRSDDPAGIIREIEVIGSPA